MGMPHPFGGEPGVAGSLFLYREAAASSVRGERVSLPYREALLSLQRGEERATTSL